MPERERDNDRPPQIPSSVMAEMEEEVDAWAEAWGAKLLAVLRKGPPRSSAKER